MLLFVRLKSVTYFTAVHSDDIFGVYYYAPIEDCNLLERANEVLSKVDLTVCKKWSILSYSSDGYIFPFPLALFLKKKTASFQISENNYSVSTVPLWVLPLSTLDSDGKILTVCSVCVFLLLFSVLLILS